MADSPMMTAGEFAHRAGVTVRTIQYYDQKGLLSPTKKGPANQRLYSEADMQRLDRILTLKYLGFSLNSILKLGDDLGTSDEVAAAVRESRERLDDDLMQLFGRMATLKKLSERLAAQNAGATKRSRSVEDEDDSAGEVDWRVLAQTIENGQQHDAWRRLLEDDATGPDSISREEVLAWHALMGDTIEAMEAGSPVDSAEVQALAERFRHLGGMKRAREGLGNMMRGVPGAHPMAPHGQPGAQDEAAPAAGHVMAAAGAHGGTGGTHDAVEFDGTGAGAQGALGDIRGVHGGSQHTPHDGAPHDELAAMHAHAGEALPEEPTRGRDFYHALQKRTLGFLQRALEASSSTEEPEAEE